MANHVHHRVFITKLLSMPTDNRNPIRKLCVLMAFVTLPVLGGGLNTGCDTASGCCKVCEEGKACGDACIDADDTCTAGDGCACNG